MSLIPLTKSVILSIQENGDESTKTQISVMLKVLELLNTDNADILQSFVNLIDTNDTAVLNKATQSISELENYVVLHQHYINHKNVYCYTDDDFDDYLIQNNRNSQWVYFIQDSINNTIKIGYTNLLQPRLKNLQTGNPNTLSIVGYIETTNMRTLEGKFHKYYRDNRVSGEWFNITLDELSHILAEYRLIKDKLFDESDECDELVDESLEQEELIEHTVEKSNTIKSTKQKTLESFFRHIYNTKPSWYLENGKVSIKIIENAYREYFEDYEIKSHMISRHLNGNLFKPASSTQRSHQKQLVSYNILKQLF